MNALNYLQELKESGDITEVGLVNFDAARTDEICTQFPGLIVSNQVQVSSGRCLGFGMRASRCVGSIPRGIRRLTFTCLACLVARFLRLRFPPA